MAEEKKFRVRITSPELLRDRLRYCYRAAEEWIKGGELIVTLSSPEKSRDQECRYHAMIEEIAQQVEVEGRRYDFETWKALLVDSFEEDLRSGGEKLTHPGKTVISLDGRRAVSLRPSTSRFRKKEGSDFIEYLFSFGAEHGVVFRADRFAETGPWPGMPG